MTYRSLTPQEIDDIALSAARGQGTLDVMLSDAMFGGPPPRYWRDWPKEARDTWDAAISLWSYYTRGRGMGRAPRVGLERAWEAVLESADMPPAERYGWTDLANRLHTLPRKAEYQLVGRLRFAFKGRPPNRRLVRGPCMLCGEVRPVEELVLGTCGPCLEREASPDKDPGIALGEYARRGEAQSRGQEREVRFRAYIRGAVEFIVMRY